MLGMTATTTFYVALLATVSGEYQEAFHEAEEQGKPFLVLVGASWCPGCRVMKQETMPELSRNGELEEVVYVEVDMDARPKLSRKLLRENSIPQLVLYTPLGKLWRRVHLTGAHSAPKTRTFLKREIAAGRQIAEKRRREAVASAYKTRLTKTEQK